MEELIGFSINKTAHKFRKEVRLECESQGIPASYMYVLMFLSSNSDSKINQKDICNFAKFKASTISVTLSNMENDGLISRTKCDKDGRKTFVELTKDGKKLGSKIKKIIDKLENDLKNVLKENELKTFLKLNSKISDYLERRIENA